MAHLSNEEHIPCWDKFILFKRNKVLEIDNFYLESNEIKHEYIKEEQLLHKFRNRIKEYDEKLVNGKNWEYYKKVVNPYELVYTQKKYDSFPESICFLKPLSRSYFKMVEILDLLSFKGYLSSWLKIGHVCEGPGGFIEAIVDISSKLNKKIQLSVAMTLKSKQNNIPGWRKATRFIKKNRMIRIIYGEDTTGNIMKPENQQYFVEYVMTTDNGGKLDIFTADGGFDFSGDYMKQEEMVFPLLLASVKIGFEVLKKGGIFILKIFDFYHRSTVDLIYLLSCYFEEWTLYKPCMSRPCNPEHYFIGKGFVGCSEDVLDRMRLWMNIIDNNEILESLFKVDIMKEDEKFMEIIHSLREHSFKTQTEYLEKVFTMIDLKDDDIIKQYLKRNEKYSYDWCVRFRAPICANRSLLTVE